MKLMRNIMIPCSFPANIFTTISTLSLQLMLILIGKGYTVTRARLKARTTVKIHSLMASYTVLYMSLLMYEQYVSEPPHSFTVDVSHF